jgi:hypothetical protein
MAGFLDSTVKEIDDRLRTLKEEVSRLEAARSALVGTRRGPGRPRSAATARTQTARTQTATRRTRRRASTAQRTRARRGRRGGNTRANQALQLVRNKPGITIPQIAQSMGIEPNYLYRVMPKLVEDGRVKRQGNGWHAAS